jgi:MFS family permease
MDLIKTPSLPTRGQLNRVACGATIGNMLSMTPCVAAVLGTLLVPISEDFGWTRTEVAGAFTAFSLCAAAAFPFAGRLADRIGTRPVLVTGYVLLGLTIIALSAAPASHFGFYALFGLSGLVGVLPSTMLLSKLISEWFDNGRAFWMAFTSGIGNAVGASLTPIIAAALMVHYGWRTAFFVIGASVLLIGVPSAYLLLRAPPARNGRHAGVNADGFTVAEIVRRPLFWLILSSVPVAGGSLTAVLANTVPIVTSRGLSVAEATGVVAAFAMIVSVWKPIVGFMLDRTKRPLVVAPFYALAMFGALGLAHLQGHWSLTLSGALTGIGMGAEFSVMLYILSRYFGLRSMGTIGGIASTVVLLSNAVVPIALNLAFDRLGTYAPALYFVAAMLMYNAILFLFLPRYPDDFDAVAK